MRRIFIFLLTAIALTLASCGGGGDPSPDDPIPTVTPATNAATPGTTPAAAATATSPAIEATTPIGAHTASSPTATPQPPTATAAPATSTAPPPPPPPPATPTPPPPATNPMSATVGVSGVGRFFWSPGKVAIAPGGSVTWQWSGNDFHDVRVDALGYSSGNPAKEGSYTLTFPAAGTYAASCTIHPDTMRGTVVVE